MLVAGSSGARAVVTASLTRATLSSAALQPLPNAPSNPMVRQVVRVLGHPEVGPTIFDMVMTPFLFPNEPRRAQMVRAHDLLIIGVDESAHRNDAAAIILFRSSYAVCVSANTEAELEHELECGWFA